MTRIISYFFLAIISFANEVPQNVLEEINRSSRSVSENSSERREYVEWQTEAYKKLDEELKTSQIPVEEQKKIEIKLKSQYGSNYVKQHSKLKEEISNYVETEKKVQAQVQEILQNKKSEKIKIHMAEINKNSQKELEIMTKSAEIPTPLMNRFKSEAERLYPGNYYEQKRYIESSIGNYQYYKTLK